MARVGRSGPANKGQETPMFTKEQLISSKTLGLPRDAAAAVLEDGKTYTKDAATKLVSNFMKREA